MKVIIAETDADLLKVSRILIEFRTGFNQEKKSSLLQGRTCVCGSYSGIVNNWILL